MLIIERSLAPCQMSQPPSQAEPRASSGIHSPPVGRSAGHRGGAEAATYSSGSCKSLGNGDGKAPAKWQLPAAQQCAGVSCAYPGVLGKHPLLCPLHRFQCLAFSLAVWMGAGKLKTILMVAAVGCLSCARTWGTLQGSGIRWLLGCSCFVCAAGHCCAARARDLGV